MKLEEVTVKKIHGKIATNSKPGLKWTYKLLFKNLIKLGFHFTVSQVHIRLILGKYAVLEN